MSRTPYINIHTHCNHRIEDEISVVNVFAKELPEIIEDISKPISVGLHPWHIDKATFEDDLLKVKKAARTKNVVAIGEAGLDRKTSTPWELQREVFVRQLAIAADSDKPVIVHCVKAHYEIISIIRETGFDGKLIFHGFNQNIHTAGQLLKNGFYLSFGESLFKENSSAAKLFTGIPDDRIFLETDESDYSIRQIYQRAAELKKTDVETLKRIVFTNFTGIIKM